MPERTLTYFRTQWLDGAIPGYKNLEEVVREVLRIFPTVPASRVTKKDGVIIEIRHRSVPATGPVLIHCASHLPGAEGSLVPDALAKASAPLEKLAPPKNKNFLDGALAALITGNHCLLCTAGLSQAALRYFLYSLVQKSGLPKQALRFQFAAVANRKKVLEVIESGVAEVGLSATMDELAHTRKGPAAGVARPAKFKLRDTVATLLAPHHDVAKLLAEDLSNVNAKLVVSFKKRGHGFLDQESFDDLARHVAEEEEPGIYIKLRSGTIIDSSNVKLTMRVKIKNFGNTIDHKDAWQELGNFFESLEADKLLT